MSERTPLHINAGQAAALLILAVCLIRIPVPDNQGRALMRVLAEIGLCLVFAGYVARSVNEWAGAFVALAVFSWAYTLARVGDPTAQRVSYLARDGILFGVGALVLFKAAAKEHKGLILDAMIVAGLANLVFIFLQTVGIDPYSVFTLGVMDSTWIHPTGLMSNKNETSCLFALCAFACFRHGRARFLPLMILGLVFAKSTGGVMALAAGFSFLWLASGQRLSSLLWTAAVPMLVYVLLFDSSVSIAFTERFRIWGLGDTGLVERPFLGVGLGLWPLATGQIHAHNEFLQAWFEMGYLAPVILSGYAATVWRRYRPEAVLSVAAVIAASVNCLVSFPMHIAPTALMVLAWAGIMEEDLC